MISIVIPLYNKEEYIVETINSVLNQTYKQFEILVIDDGSTDDSIRRIESIQDDRIVLISQKNAGVSAARNNGVKQAKYNWIAFLDADDWWSQDYLQETVNLIKKYPENKMFATGRCRVFGKTIERYNNRFLPPENKDAIVDYIEVVSEALPPINSSNTTISRDILIQSGGFTEGQTSHEDHDLWLRLCKNEKIAFINKNLSFYRKGIATSVSNGIFSYKDFKHYMETIKEVKKEISEKRNQYFKIYYNRFILLTFIKFQVNYNSTEKETLINLIQEICESKYHRLIKGINLIPFGISYKFLKLIRK